MKLRPHTFAERAVFEQCPVCLAVKGEPCIQRPGELRTVWRASAGGVGAHLQRLDLAPSRIPVRA